MSQLNRSRRGPARFIPLLLIIAVVILVTHGFWSPRKPTDRRSPAQRIADLVQMVTPPADLQRKEGVAAAVLIDVSGSMLSKVPDADGSKRRKIDIARSCVERVVRQADGFAKEQRERPMLLGLYEFSGRSNQPDCRVLLPLSKPDPISAAQALVNMNAGGDTPIGDAILAAKKDLDATGLSRLHILVVTDGDNTKGYAPQDVVAAINKVPQEQRAGVYFIAFDVAASVFTPVKEAGAIVLPAANAQELQRAMDALMSEKILVE